MSTDYHAFLGTTVDVCIDRPMGSIHPTHGYVYPLNYGFIPNTEAEDGEEVDVYLLGAGHPIERTSAIVVGIAHRNDDDEDKLIATIDGSVPSLQEIKSELHFQEQFFDTRYTRVNTAAQ